MKNIVEMLIYKRHIVMGKLEKRIMAKEICTTLKIIILQL